MSRSGDNKQFFGFGGTPVGVFAELSGVGGFARDKLHGTRGNGFNVVERVKVHELTLLLRVGCVVASGEAPLGVNSPRGVR